MQLIYSLMLVGTLLSCKKNKAATDTDTAKPLFAKGADISWLTQMEASGIKFYNACNY